MGFSVRIHSNETIVIIFVSKPSLRGLDCLSNLPEAKLKRSKAPEACLRGLG
jgi:hypothetical protein